MKKIYLFKTYTKRHLQSALSKKLLKKIRVKANGLPYHSVSHKYSNGIVYIAICVSSKPCGIDIEIMKKMRKSSLGFFKQEEYKKLRIKNKNLAFFMLWTAKEAIIKKMRSDKDIRKDICLTRTYKHKLHFANDRLRFSVNMKLLKNSNVTVVLSVAD